MNHARLRLPLTTAAALLVSFASSASARAQDAPKTVAAPAAAAPPPPAPAAAPPPAPPPPAPPPPPPDAPPHFPSVGGHVGIATPLVTAQSKGDAPTGPFKSTTIAKNGTVLDPIGVTVHLSPTVAIDFEMVVANNVAPGPTSTGLIVDPGIIYNAGPVALGLRLAFQPVGSQNGAASVGLIPLVNRGLINFGAGTWFAEVAFPTFVVEQSVQFNVVLHTGIGF